mgnify:FL=1
MVGGVNFVILTFGLFVFTFAGGGGGGGGGGGATFASLPSTFAGGVNSTFSIAGGFGGGGGGGSSLFCAWVTMMMQTRQTGNNKLFFM